MKRLLLAIMSTVLSAAFTLKSVLPEWNILRIHQRDTLFPLIQKA